MKALALLSGGLDSTLAVKLIIEQGTYVEAINFVAPFCQCRRGECGASEAAKNFNIPLKVVSAGSAYLRVVRNPKFGYGKNLKCALIFALTVFLDKSEAERLNITVLWAITVL